MNDINPLAEEPQREKSGGRTLGKYDYQYHWAFCRILSEFEAGNEYALFMELHEDVVIANSLDATLATFELNQVKATTKVHSINTLCAIKKNESSSIIGKLGQGTTKKSFSKKISNVNLVSTGGYKFDLHSEGFSFEIIESGKLTTAEIDSISKCLKNEIGDDSIVSKIAFIIPDLQEKGFEDAVEGRISKLINKISPGCKYNSSYIYDCIIQDLRRRGKNTFDYSNWNDALRKKAITSNQVAEIINSHTSRKPDEALNTELLDILKCEYKLTSTKRAKIISAFNRYYTRRISDRDPVLSDIASELRKLIAESIETCPDAPSLELQIISKLSEESLHYFASKEEITGAFLYEMLNHEQSKL